MANQSDLDRIDQIMIGGEKRRFEKGDLSAVLNCLFYCLSSDPKTPIPKWCAIAFCDAYRKVISYEFKSWDDVFGRPHRKGVQLEKERDLYKNRMAVYNRVEELINAGEPIDNGLFERVGKELGVGGKTTTEKHYYYVKNVHVAIQRMKEMDAAGQVVDIKDLFKEYGVDECFRKEDKKK